MGNMEQRNRPGGAGRQITVWLAIILGFLLMFGLSGNMSGLGGKTRKVTYDEFLRMVEARPQLIKAVRIDKKEGDIVGEYLTTGMPADSAKNFTVQGQPPSTLDWEFTKWLAEKNIKVTFTPASSVWESIIYFFLPVVILILFFYFFIGRQMRGGGSPFSFGKIRANRVEKGKNKKTFNDVAGVDEAREEVREIVDFLRSPERAERLGGRLPRGVLLVGPPGTGKTLLAKAIAGEADVPFFSISGSDFIEMFVGVGASRVRDLFDQAKSNSPCIIFIDEIDAIGRKRVNEGPGGGQEAAQTLNAILVEMDGFTSDDKVIVIAATNRADVLDPALLRPGRFDRRINVDLPDIKGREEILKVHVKNVKVAADVDLGMIARGTPTFSGAELENIVNEAALIAAFTDREAVDQACFEEARDKVRWGKEKKTRVMSDEDRHDTAVHEAGHALLMKFLPHATPLHKVSIIPRGRALGVTMQLPEKDEYNMTYKKIMGEVTVIFGGRAAEELFLDDISTGASNDIQQATRYIRGLVCEWGMTAELGLINYNMPNNDEQYFVAKPGYSEATAEMIDRKVREIMDDCYRQAKTVLQEHEKDLRLLVDALMEFEVLGKEEVNLLLETQSLDELRAYREAHKPILHSEAAAGEKPAAEDDKATESPDEKIRY